MGLAALIASCSDDDRNNDTDNQHLVSPSMAVSISNTNGRQSPFTGILTIMPCDANRKVCQNAHLHYFTYKAPTFTSWGFVIT